MKLSGQHILGSSLSAAGNSPFGAINPATGQKLEPSYREATLPEIDRALQLACDAFRENRVLPSPARSELLESIANEIEGLGEQLVEQVTIETALPEARVRGERQRTTAQIRMFADLVREGSWVSASIDRAILDRKPVPRPDLRQMLVPVGPVAVFGASNFPLAFSTGGGDTASALAAGCPVVVKAHPAHPGTSELVGRAIQKAVASSPFHEGTFSLLHGRSPEVSLALVRHPATRVVAFTGSLRAGRAIHEAAANRLVPIPVYAEMGSVNPVFILPGALASRMEELSEGLTNSVCMGVGQFCTNPGIVLGLRSELLQRFIQMTATRFASLPEGIMLTAGIRQAYGKGVAGLLSIPGVRLSAQRRPAESGDVGTRAGATLLATDDETFLGDPRLAEEVFGPSTLIVECSSEEHLMKAAASLPGSLTVTIHGTEQDLQERQPLLRLLEERVGRIIFNGFPTGVEVCASMHHGGPYPATTDAKFTSVGTKAIYRFARPICYQNLPQSSLPDELKDDNPRKIWRLIDNQWKGA
jgi:2,5-dioxopentanoate dehydrogenase